MAGKILANVRATSSGSQSLSVSSIPQTFSHLEIVIHGQSTNTTTALQLKFNGSSSNDHYSHYCQSYTSNAGSVSAGGGTTTTYCPLGNFGNNGSTYKIWIPNYSSASVHKPFSYLGGDLANNVSYADTGWAGYGTYMSNSAITSVSINAVSIESGSSIILFGWL